MPETTIDTAEQLRVVLDRISFRPSCVNMDWVWEIEVVSTPVLSNSYQVRGFNERGWFVNTTFKRPDTDTGAIGRGKGRQEFIAKGSSVSSVVKTCWLLAELIVRHELMEAFCFDGARVFDPHKTVEELCFGARNRRL